MSQKRTSYKCTLLGDSRVGKTFLMNRIAYDRFGRRDELCTIGIDLGIKKFSVNGKEIKLQIWDTVGGQRFRGAIPPNHYKGAAGFFLMYDITDMETFRNLPRWLEEVWKYVDIEVPTVIVGNKKEEGNECRRQVSYEEAEKFAKENWFEFFEVSAKTGENVEKAFLRMAELIDEKMETICYKCVLMGEKAVGKSNLVFQLLNKTSKYKANKNLKKGQIYDKQYKINGKDMTLCISDTGEFFLPSSSPYYHDLFGAILVYDITSQESFVKIPKWLDETRERCGKETMLVLVGNKADKASMRVVSYEEGEEFAKENGLMFFETFWGNPESVETVFLKMAEAMKIRAEEYEIQRNNQVTALKLGNKNQTFKSESCAC